MAARSKPLPETTTDPLPQCAASDACFLQHVTTGRQGCQLCWQCICPLCGATCVVLQLCFAGRHRRSPLTWVNGHQSCMTAEGVLQLRYVALLTHCGRMLTREHKSCLGRPIIITSCCLGGAIITYHYMYTWSDGFVHATGNSSAAETGH